MAMLLSVSIGIREEMLLACIFMLMATTQIFGWLTELYSRPVVKADKTSYAWPVGRRGFIEKPDYHENQQALYIIDGTKWEGDRIVRDDDGKIIVKNFDYLHAQRTSNWLRRLVPFYCGWLPYMTVIVLNVWFLEYQSSRLYEDSDGSLRIPPWVRAALYGTYALFTSFAFVLPLYQFLPPAHYWGAEISYNLLSLSSKMFLGWLMLFNTIMTESRAEEVLGAAALESAR
jgi:hypothetical protein